MHGGRRSLTQPFVAAELAVLGETDCCGSAAFGVSGGVTQWNDDRRSGLRIEGRVLLPARGEGVLIMVQVGLTRR